jgi:VIT1/CCC1 family predicted Fe2+/Mn2+ transporter
VTVGSQKKRERVLDPVERLSEVLFGLIMVLSFTGSISVASAEREEVREVLIGAIGCNLAWGIVDAIMYLLAIVLERGRNLALGRAIRASKDAELGRRLIAEALPEPLDELFEPTALEAARQKVVALPGLRERPHLGRKDLAGAFGVFLLVFLSTFPVVVPFLFLQPLRFAMRVSNGVAIALLYVAGHLLARYSGLRPVRTGLVMVALGIVLVGITIALGG